ncbi:putative nuclease HARBI1 [Pseudophryne corroboree]|uniref:putative nuclease HARBI1 n=1 Tax=Pseudophryne corroboree TaxID=495146 RepID=UPI003081BD34
MEVNLKILKIILTVILTRDGTLHTLRTNLHGQDGSRSLRRRRIFLCRKQLKRIRESKVLKMYRLPSEAIVHLYQKIKRDISPKTKRSHAILGITKLLATLQFLASGSYQYIISDLGGVSQASFSRFFCKVLDAILKHCAEYIHFPNSNAGWIALKKGFYNIKGFPNVVGAIDCTHVPFTPSQDMEEVTRNRKQFNSMNCQAICDHNTRFMNVFAAYPGSTHDAYILRNSNIFQKFENLDFPDGWLLGDSGYGCRPWLMTPFRNPKGRAEKKYNRAHILTRGVIERSFGLLKSRFRCLAKTRGALQYSAAKMCKMFIVCCILHNMCLDYKVDMDDTKIAPEPCCSFEKEVNELVTQKGKKVRSNLVENWFSKR